MNKNSMFIKGNYLTKKIEIPNKIEALHMQKWLKFKKGEKNVRTQYNNKTDMFEVLYDVKVKESK